MSKQKNHYVHKLV